MIKLIGVLRRRPGLSVQEFRHEWNRHADLARGSDACTRYVRRYIQCYALPEEYEHGEPPFDGVAELWFDSKDDIDAFYSDPEYLEVLGPDLQRFADLSQIRRIVTRENPVLEMMK